MPPSLAERLAAGREAAAERRRAEDDAHLVDYRDWLRMESAAMAALNLAREIHGPHSPEAAAAYGEWRAAMSLIPQLPTNGAFQRERGESQNSDDDEHCRNTSYTP